MNFVRQLRSLLDPIVVGVYLTNQHSIHLFEYVLKLRLSQLLLILGSRDILNDLSAILLINKACRAHPNLDRWLLLGRLRLLTNFGLLCAFAGVLRRLGLGSLLTLFVPRFPPVVRERLLMMIKTSLCGVKHPTDITL